MDIEKMVLEAQQGNQQAFEEVCNCFARLVKASVNRFYLFTLREEAACEANMALVEAIQTYRLDKKVRFAGYADACIRFRLWNLYKKEKRRWQRERFYLVHCDEDFTEQELIDYETDVEMEVTHQVYIEQVSPQLFAYLAALPHVIRRSVLEQARLVQIAAELGITVSSVWNIKKRALARLKKFTSGMYSSEEVIRDGSE